MPLVLDIPAKLAWRQRGIRNKRVIPAGNFRPKKRSTKVFGAPFYKKARWFSKNSSRLKRGIVNKWVKIVKKHGISWG
jgi:hypothetical protein